MSLLENMPHLMTVKKRTYVNDAYGGNDETPVNQSINNRCWVQNASFQDILEFEKRDERVTHRVLMPTDLSLTPGLVIVPEDGPFQDLELVVRAYTERTAGLGWMFTAFCEEENNQQ